MTRHLATLRCYRRLRADGPGLGPPISQGVTHGPTPSRGLDCTLDRAGLGQVVVDAKRPADALAVVERRGRRPTGHQSAVRPPLVPCGSGQDLGWLPWEAEG